MQLGAQAAADAPAFQGIILEQQASISLTDRPHLDKVVHQRQLGLGRKADAAPVLGAHGLLLLLLLGGGGFQATQGRPLLDGLQGRGSSW
jgi:hypothetical protein